LGYWNIASTRHGTKSPEKEIFVLKTSFVGHHVCILPNVEKNTAPTRLMNGSKSGTAIPIPAITKIINERIPICAILCLLFGTRCATRRQTMSLGT
jgi:hypothetical protein